MSAAATVSPIDRSVSQANGLLNQTGANAGGTPFASLVSSPSISDLASLSLTQSVNLNARLAKDGLAVRAPEPPDAADRPYRDQVREFDEDTDDRAPDRPDRPDRYDAPAPNTDALQTTVNLNQHLADDSETRSLPPPLGGTPGTVEPQPSAARQDVAARAPIEPTRPQPEQALQRPPEQSSALLKGQVTEPQKPLISQPNTALSARAAVAAQIAGDKSTANPSLDGGLIGKANSGSPTAANTLAQHSHGQAAVGNATLRGQVRPQATGGNTGTAGTAGTAAAKAPPATATAQPATQTTAGATNARTPLPAGLTGSGQSGAQQPAPQFADVLAGNGNTLTHAPESSRGSGPTQLPRTHPPVPPRVVTNQVAVQIQKAVAQGTDRINIQLKPAELGRVEIRLDVAQDGRVSAVISADRQDTLELLQRDARTLHTTLQDAGLKTGSDSLNFELRQHGSTASNGDDAEGGFEDNDQSAEENAVADVAIQSGLAAHDRIDIEI